MDRKESRDYKESDTIEVLKMKPAIKERKLRSVLKAITEKILEISVSALILQVVFRQPYVALGLSTMIEGLQLSTYYLHERIWDRISYGKECIGCHYQEFHEKVRQEGLPHD